MDVDSECKKPRFKRWLANLLIVFMMITSLLTFTLIPLSDSSSTLNSQQVFESSRWHSLQLQLQTYRLMDYLSDLSEADLPVNGNAYFQYDLVLSRVDLLRKGDLGSNIRNFANGRAVRLLNIIAGELELISLNVQRLEQGQLDQTKTIVDRLRSLDSQITDFVVIVNQGANDFITEKRHDLDVQLAYIQMVSLVLFVISSTLLYITYKVSKELRQTLIRNTRLEERIDDVQAGKVDIISRIVNDIKPIFTNLISHSNTLKNMALDAKVQEHLEHLSTQSNQLLTQLDCYYDLTLIEANRMSSVTNEGNLREHINYAVSALERVFLIHQVRAIAHVDPRLPELVETDFRRLHEILVTLISNLAPYCHNAELLIQVRPSTLPIFNLPEKHGNKATKMVQISLRDSGEGLPNKVQVGLRKNPYNPANTIIGQIHQMGMGFTFCHYLIGALGGELHFSSSQGTGTEIWIDLPMGLGDAKAQAIDKNTTKQAKVAIWQSDSLLDQPFITLLQQLNHQVDLFTEGDLTRLLQQKNLQTLPFECILITDKSVLDEEQIELIERLQAFGSQVIVAASVIEDLPRIKADKTYHYPVTSAQLEALLLS